MRAHTILLALAAFLSACAFPMAVAPRPTDDFGPKPKDPGGVIAAWLNARSISLSRGPCTAGELKMSEPATIVLAGLTGRKAGWQVILGPENSRMVDYTEVSYTRVVIHRDRVISVVSSSFPM